MTQTWRVDLTKRIGKSPIGGYFIYDMGASFELNAINRSSGLMTTQNIRLPKDVGELCRVFAALLRAADAELSAQAIMVGLLDPKLP